MDTPRRRIRLLYLACLVFISVWLVCWLTATRYALLDDALIHLRYADMLYVHHFITFDGIRHGFGTSSLLYVSLLAFLQRLFPSPLLPKAVSDVAYLALLGTIFWLIPRFRSSLLSQMFLGGLLLCLLSPMGIRWSTDGMETSLTNLFVVLLAVFTGNEQEEKRFSMGRTSLLVLFGAALVLLRIELALVVALSCLSIFVAKISADHNWQRSVVEACPLGLGAGLALIGVRIAMGHFLPDTALAKSGHHFSIGPLFAATRAMGGALLAGFGMALWWALSVIFTMRRVIRGKAHVSKMLLLIAIQNSAIFIIVGMSCLRNQRIQGVRYLMWPLIFGIVMNGWLMTGSRAPEPTGEAVDTLEKRAIAAFVIIALCLLPVDWRLASRSMRGRSRTFLEMRAAHLDRLFRNKTIVASDVGFVTYFTDARTCDLAGLVDGRGMAALTVHQRLAYCAAQSPSMMFLTRGQASAMGTVLDLKQWRVCGSFDFTNVESNDRHYLLVPSVNAANVCRTLSFSPEALSAIQSGS